MSSDSTKAVSDDIVNTSTEITSTTSADKGDTLPSNSIVATSSTEAIATSPEDVTTAHASAITTSTKRKLASPEAQQRPLKKGRSVKDFEFIRDTFGYTFKNLDLLDEALDTTGLYRPQSNQSLALIGDSILQLTIYRDWYPSRQLKGTGNQLVQTIGCNANLAKVATRIGLDEYIVTAQGIVPPQSLLATTMEAVLGAIDCDSGEDANAVRRAMYKVGLTLAGTH